LTCPPSSHAHATRTITPQALFKHTDLHLPASGQCCSLRPSVLASTAGHFTIPLACFLSLQEPLSPAHLHAPRFSLEFQCICYSFPACKVASARRRSPALPAMQHALPASAQYNDPKLKANEQTRPPDLSLGPFKPGQSGRIPTTSILFHNSVHSVRRNRAPQPSRLHAGGAPAQPAAHRVLAGCVIKGPGTGKGLSGRVSTIRMHSEKLGWPGACQAGLAPLPLLPPICAAADTRWYFLGASPRTLPAVLPNGCQKLL